MIKYITILTALVLFMMNGKAQSTIHVDALQFNQLIQSGEGVILDVRTENEYSRGHIALSTLISVSDKNFVSKINLLQKDKPVYLYCLTGSRSRAAANYMVKIGFKEVYNLQRGILDWQRNSLPVVKSENTVASVSTTYTPDSFNSLIQSEKLVLVDFHAPWCAPCKQMSPIIDQLSNDFKGKVKVEKVDVESNRTIAEANQIQSIPGFILYKDGQRIWTHKGMISHSELTSLLEKHL